MVLQRQTSVFLGFISSQVSHKGIRRQLPLQATNSISGRYRIVQATLQLHHSFSSSSGDKDKSNKATKNEVKGEVDNNPDKNAALKSSNKDSENDTAQSPKRAASMKKVNSNSDNAEKPLSFLERFGNLEDIDSTTKAENTSADSGSFLDRFSSLDVGETGSGAASTSSEKSSDEKSPKPGSFLERFRNLDSTSSDGKKYNPGSFLERFGNLDDDKSKNGKVSRSDALKFAKMRQLGGTEDAASKENDVLDVAKEIAQLTEDKPYYPGQIYDPIDLVTGDEKVNAPIRRRFLRRKPKPRRLIQTGMEIHPLNTWFLSRFLSPTGKILSRRETGLNAKTQRKVAKAIKASRQLGLMPVTTRIDERVEWDRGLEPYVRRKAYPDNEPAFTYKEYVDPESEE
eukprot:CAMPEP_0204829528 /NCGR_PEP_ID=MMETSP1346-20131115/7754_1 /ASSEMBLY_ACC=CAM_ASM_000771 /TAXON_ID=215587 /ORGANISM="Aplanochytrium stocchinoi, Strain GSBS06" /LENGTH=398 /DNA_ID=CAMNT_0051959409 /DNA_START=310 /DNA_END=1506 /DNA_ORIENTATION=-